MVKSLPFIKPVFADFHCKLQQSVRRLVEIERPTAEACSIILTGCNRVPQVRLITWIRVELGIYEQKI